MVLTQFQRYAIVTLRKEGHTNQEIINEMRRQHRIKIDRRTVQRTWARYKNGGLISDRPRRGRNKVWSDRQERAVKRLALRNRWASLPELTETINNDPEMQGARTSEPTLRRTLKKFGIRRRVAAAKPLLTEQQRTRRLDFAQRYGHLPAPQWQRCFFR